MVLNNEEENTSIDCLIAREVPKFRSLRSSERGLEITHLRKADVSSGSVKPYSRRVEDRKILTEIDVDDLLRQTSSDETTRRRKV